MDTDKFGLLGKVLEAKGEIDRWVNALIERRLSGQLLRWSLRISFLWFGALKLISDASPVVNSFATFIRVLPVRLSSTSLRSLK